MSTLELAGFGYHDVTDDVRDSGFQRPAAWPYKLGWSAFRDHLDALGRAGAPTLISSVSFKHPRRHLLLTFDDGGKSARAIGDELARRGWRGHFFIVTQLIDAPGFLSVADLRYLHECGHVLGSHSHTHPNIFRNETRAGMAAEWARSADILQQLLGAPCVSAAVPGGDISTAVLESAADAGFRYLFTSEPWLRPRRVRDCWVLGRYCATASTPTARIAELAHFRTWRRALLARRLKGAARRAFPLLYRTYVRSQTRELPGIGVS